MYALPLPSLPPSVRLCPAALTVEEETSAVSPPWHRHGPTEPKRQDVGLSRVQTVTDCGSIFKARLLTVQTEASGSFSGRTGRCLLRFSPGVKQMLGA